MMWSLCTVLLVVVAVAGRMGERVGRGKEGGVESSLLTTIAKVGGQVEEREMTKARWYCYAMSTLAEEPIAMSQIVIFAGGENKEGKTIKLGELSLLTSNEDRSKGQYCAVVSPSTNEQPLTPNNDKIKYITMDTMKFYSIKVLVRDPLSLLEGFNRLKALLTRTGLSKKAQLDRPAVIYNVAEAGGEILFPQD